MTPAEDKFAEIEFALMRARDLTRVLRHVTDCGHDQVDRALWGGIYILACEVETALDASAETWSQAQALASGH